MMKRDIALLADSDYDVVVAGGGIHGAAIFYRLAAAGLRVALVERDDFCGATSANSLKILHGGLRYLQHANIKRMRESINSRKDFMQMAPQLIEPMPCIMPTCGLGMQGRPVMGIAMLLFDLISWDRNQGAPARNRVGRSRLLSRNECLRIAPGIDPAALSGAALWHDDLITDTERMTLAFVKAGCAAGGVAANYVTVRKFSREKNRITGIEATDRLSGRTFAIRAGLAVNSTGPWVDEVRRESHQARITEDLAKAVNIVVDRPLFAGHGVGLSGTGEFVDRDAKIKRGKRLFFFAPWQEKTMIGTTYSYFSGQRDELRLTDADIQEILDEVNTIYPSAGLTMEHVVFAHTGLMPAHKPEGGPRAGTPQLVKHSKVIDHAALEGIEGLLTIEGVKYTTAPAIARQVEKVVRGKNLLPRNSAARKQHSTKVDDSGAPHVPSTTSYTARYPHIPAIYDRESEKIFSIAATEAGAGNSISRRPPLIAAEVLYCVREEMAVKLQDVILRRTNCGGHGCPPDGVLRGIADLMAGELGWDEEAILTEMEQVRSYYRERISIPC